MTVVIIFIHPHHSFSYFSFDINVSIFFFALTSVSEPVIMFQLLSAGLIKLILLLSLIPLI